MSWTLHIPREIQSGNVFSYGHWRDRMRDRDAWIVLLRSTAYRIPPATAHRSVTVTAYRGRRLDEDNLCSGFKHGRDAMVRVGLLLDDNRKWCRFTYEDCRILSELPAELVEKHGRKALTIINISDTPTTTA